MKAALSWLRPRRAVAAAAPAAPALTGGGSSTPAGAAAKASRRVTIVGNSSLRFSPMTAHLHSSTVTGDPGGSQASFTATFSHPGRYLFHGQYHASAGMTGVFLIS